MQRQPYAAPEVRDQELDTELKAAASEELDDLTIQNQRLARIQDYEEAAVARDDPLAAVIGMGNAYLQRIFEHLGAALLDQMDGRSHSPEELRKLAPEMHLLVKLRKAIETDLAFRADDAEQATALPRSRLGGKGHDPGRAGRGLVPQRWANS